MNLEKIKKQVEELLKKEAVEVISVKTKKEFGMQILEIVVDGNNLDAEKLGYYNEMINDLIDDDLPEDYYLEVSTMGAIRPINSLEEAKKHIGKYVLVIIDKDEYKGILTKVDDLNIYIKVNIRGRMKVFELPFKEINKFELTVKF